MSGSPLISPGLIKRLRIVANRGLQTTITLYRRTGTGENPYGMDEDIYDEGTVVEAWVREQGTAVIKDYDGRAGDIGDYRIHMRAEIESATGDRVKIGDDMYEVQDSNMQNTYRVFTTVMAKRLQP